ncbi:MAG: hypothetical protein ACLSIR_07455 [Christensenellales bacterium]
MMEENQRTLEFAARFASEKGIARYTRFLDPVQVAAAKQIAREHGAAFSVWGGYEQAERQIGCFLPWEKRLLRVIFRLFACIPVSLPNSALSLIVIFWAHLWL